MRPTTSEVEDHTKRPSMFIRLSRPTNPAAAAAEIAVVPSARKKSRIIGEACSRMPMPAVTLQNSRIHSSQNCGVRTAVFARTSPSVTRARAEEREGS